MKVKQVADILGAKILTGEEFMENEVESACGSDLMSDVLAFVKDQGMVLTGLINPQVIRTAEMMDIHTIVFVRGKMPDDSVIDMAKERDMVLLATTYPLYIACGKLYSAGLDGNPGSSKKE